MSEGFGKSTMPAPPAPSLKRLPAATCGKAALSILVAEDESISRLFLARFLATMGHRVVTAKNGQEVLTVLESSEPFDLLLTDIQMPIVDGVELVRVLRNDQRYHHRHALSVIAMTAYGTPGDQEAFLHAGMDEYLPKPIDGRLLKVMLEQITRQHQ
jgi:CheY-like chemotaxis protein